MKKFKRSVALMLVVSMIVSLFNTSYLVKAQSENSFRVGTMSVSASENPDLSQHLNMFIENQLDVVGIQGLDNNTSRNPYNMLDALKGEAYPYTSYQKAFDFAGGAYGNGMISNIAMKNTSGSPFTMVSNEEPRAWQRITIEVNGKDVSVYNVFLAYESKEINLAQMRELLSIVNADTAEYKVVLGNFNVKSFRDNMNEFAANYRLANGSNENWISDYRYNVITTKNIKISDAQEASKEINGYKLFFAECELLDEAIEDEPVDTPVDANPNLALFKDVTCSSQEVDYTFFDYWAVDGDATTRWSPGYSTEEWIQVDLGEVKEIQEIFLNLYAEGPEYKVLISTDGSEYETVLYVTDGSNTNNVQKTITFDTPKQARYVKYLQMQPRLPGSDGMRWPTSVSELEVYANIREVDVPTKESVKISSFNILSSQQPDISRMIKMLEDNGIDYVGVQEVDQFTSRNPQDVMGAFSVTGTYPYTSFQPAMDFAGGQYGIGIISKTEIKATTGGSLEVKPGDEPRAWQRVLVEVDGKEIAFYNTHLSYETVEATNNQIEDLIAIMNADSTEYKVLTGDFNIGYSKEQIYPFLVDYNITNGKDGVWFNTFKGSSESGNIAIDNIITTRNMKLKDVQMVDSSDLSDHNMFFAEFELLDEAIVSTEYLDILKEKANALDADSYTEETYGALETAMSKTSSLTETSTQAEINVVVNELNAALKGLVKANANPNLALNKPVSVSSQEVDYTFFDYWAVDGDPDTRWSPGYAEEEWLQVDLGEVKDIQEIYLNLYAEGPEYKVLISTDSKNYETVLYVTDGSSANHVQKTITFDTTKQARYVKYLQMQKRLPDADGSRWPTSISELEVYGKVKYGGVTPEEATNLALNKQVYADSIEAESVRAELAVDGNKTSMESRWGSNLGSQPHWIYVDLGAVMDVRTVAVFWEMRKPTSYAIQVSNDASQWTTVKEFNDRPQSLNEYIVLDETYQARYVRLYIESFTEDDPDGGETYNTVSIYELEVYSEVVQESGIQDLLTNVAKRKPVYADSIEAESVRAELAVDGNKTSMESRWGSDVGSQPHWIYVDLEEVMDVRTVAVFWEMRKPTSYAIQVSNDASQWTTVKEFNDRPQSLNEYIVLDETYQARYVRLYIESFTEDDPDGGETWNSVSIYELEVYGGEVVQDPSDPIVIQTPTKDDTKLTYTIQDTREGIRIEYNGTDYEQVIDKDLTIYRPIVDKDVVVSFKIIDEQTGEYEFIEKTVTIPGLYEVESGANQAPVVLPELAEWKGHTGSFAVTSDAKIVVGDESLNAMADMFAQDFKEIVGQEIEVVVGNENDVNAGDYYFVLTTDLSKGLKEEGNLITISDRIVVEAETTTGAYWATRTILQALKSSGDFTIPKGIARDYPLYKVRGFILDIGRKPFSMSQLQQIVKQMSWYKLNDFQVHLNDNYMWLEDYTGDEALDAYSAFRLESDIKAGDSVVLGDENRTFTYSADLTSKDVYYTKAEFAQFIDDAKVMGVNVIPEIDTPAHSLALTKVLPELRTSTDGLDNEHLDLANQYDECYDFVTNIFDEYLLGDDPVFPEGSVVHIGCDEYFVSPNAFRQYCKDMIEYIDSTGRTARIWGSLSSIKGDGSVIVEGNGAQMNLWNATFADMMEMYDLGYELINCNDTDYYIVPNAGYYYDYLDANTMYNTPINKINSNYIPAGDAQMVGGAFAVWNDMIGINDNGISEYDIYERYNQYLGLFSAKLWGKGDMDINEAQAAADALGDAPNTNFAYDLDEVTLEDYEVKDTKQASFVSVDDKLALALNGGASYATTGLTTAGLDNVLAIKVKRTSNSTDEQILLESDYGTIKAVQVGTGKVGISRELFNYSFDYTLPVGEWVELEFRNQFETISLYVNGQLVDTLGDDEIIENRPMVATCMLPLAKIGSETNAFVGYVESVQLNDDVIVFAMADYIVIEQAIEHAERLKPYADDFTALQEAIDAVVYGKAENQQAEVDAMAKAIIDAIAGLTLHPIKVTNVEVKTIDYKTIELSWDVARFTNYYVVERLDTTTGEWIVLGETSEPTYTVEGVKTGKEYTYRVKAAMVDSEQEVVYGEYSDAAKGKTMLSGEVELTLTNNGTNKFDLNWTGVEGATRYIIYRKANNGEWKKVLTLGKDARSYTTKEMVDGTYAYQVKAARYDSVDRVMSAGSNIETGIAIAEELVLTATKASETTVTLAWNKLASMKYYDVYRATSMNGKYTLLKRTSDTTAQNSVKVGKTYYYKVRAYNLVDDEKVYTNYSAVVEYCAQ